MAVVLITGLIASLPRPSIPVNGRPHTTFLLRAESDGQIWKVTIFYEDEIAVVDALAVGDAIALTGNLDIHAEADRLGRRRIAYCVTAKQLLLLRGRTPTKVRATTFGEPPKAGGFVRPRVG